MTNNMLRLRRKQQKATVRLSNFINKQTREDSRVTSARDENRQLPFTPVTGVWTTLKAKETHTNLLKNEQLNAVNVTNNKENIQQNTSEKPQKDILVDSSFLYRITSEALRTNQKHLSDDRNFSLTKKLSISYLHPNSAYPKILDGLI